MSSPVARALLTAFVVVPLLNCRCRGGPIVPPGQDAGPVIPCEQYTSAVPHVCAVTESTALPLGLAQTGAVITGGHAYVLGGTKYTSGVQSERAVYVAALDGEGNVGTWAATTSLPSPVAQAAVVASADHLYVLGGWEQHTASNTYKDSVSIGAIGADGLVTAWTEGPSLPEARSSGAAVIVNGSVYFLGGDSGDPMLDSKGPVFRASIQADGSLSPWQTTTPLPGGRALFGAAAKDGRIYVVGGTYEGAVTRCESSRVLVGSIGPDGAVTGWARERAFGDDMRSGSATIVDDILVTTVGFMVSTGHSSSSVLGAVISEDGSLGEWKILAHLPHPTSSLALASTNLAAYAFGGDPEDVDGLLPATTIIHVIDSQDTCLP